MSHTPDPPTPNILADGPLLRPDEAANLLAVKTSWIYEAVRTGRLPCIRVERHIRFTRDLLENWLSGQIGRPENQRMRTPDQRPRSPSIDSTGAREER